LLVQGLAKMTRLFLEVSYLKFLVDHSRGRLIASGDRRVGGELKT